jgi:hypothetical protein
VRTIGALATVPRREGYLERVIAAVRPQVDTLCVYLNGYSEVPSFVAANADEFILDPVNNGAERKLHWASLFDGVYLSLDDDFDYPPDYVSRMVAEVKRWGGLAVTVAHGRTYQGEPTSVHQVSPGSVGMYYRRVPEGRWVNHGSTGLMALDTTRVRPPQEWQHRNMADMQFAVWCQRSKVPMRLIEHEAHWIDTFCPLDPDGIYKSSQREGHRRRNEMLSAHGKCDGWKVFEVRT